MRHGGITGFEVKIGRDGGIPEPGTGPSIYTASSPASPTLNFHRKRPLVQNRLALDRVK